MLPFWTESTQLLTEVEDVQIRMVLKVVLIFHRRTRNWTESSETKKHLNILAIGFSELVDLWVTKIRKSLENHRAEVRNNRVQAKTTGQSTLPFWPRENPGSFAHLVRGDHVT